MVSWPQRSSKNTTVLIDRVSRAPLLERDRPRTGLLAAPWRLLMQIGSENQTTVGLEVRERLLVGRSDPTAGFQPDLDLTPYGGRENGVSRRHVAITQQGQSLFVEDLGAVNGTRINGFLLESGKLYQLRDGDELELGRLRMVVRFVRSPF
ncbi:MAG: hypothetical protein Kow0077_31500 [Anaerolineae bacterium]